MDIVKKILFILVFIFTITSLNARELTKVKKETYLFAVKGADSLYLDRYYNEDALNANSLDDSPVFVFAFGGGFFTGNRNAKTYINFYNYLVNKGYNVIAIDYRKGLEKMYKQSKNLAASGKKVKFKPIQFAKLLSNSIDIAVEDLYSATNFILSKSKQWNIDTSKIIISGSSAGAITVLQAEYYRSNNYFSNNLNISTKLPDNFSYAAVIAFAGAISPTSKHITWGSTTAPILLFHGDADSNVPYTKINAFIFRLYGSKTIAESLHKYSSPYYFYTQDNADHIVAVSPMNNNRATIDYFLNTYVKHGAKLQETLIVTTIGETLKNKKFSLKDYIISNLK